MIRLLFAFFILLTAVALGIQLNQDPGYVFITINHWTIETTVLVAVFGLLILFTLLYFFLRLSKKIYHIPAAVTQWHSKRRARKAQAMTRKGFIEYSEGYWQDAKNHLIQALPNTDTPLLNYLTAARAAQKLGDHPLRDSYLRQAQLSMPEATIAVELTQAELQLANHQWEHALATLKHLQNRTPRHPYVLKLIMQLYQEVQDWPSLIALLPQLKKYQVLHSKEYELVQYNAYLQRLIDLIKQNQIQAIYSFFRSLPKTLALNPNIIAEYVRFLLKNSDYAAAKALLNKTLSKDFQPQLIELFCLLPQEEHQLSFAENLLKKNPHSAALYLCLGQLCIRQQLWGKAKHYLQQSIEIKPCVLAYETQGILHEKLGEQVLACQNFKRGLELVTDRP